jgi:hypothetical protein
MKFPSSCLDIILRKNFYKSSDYLMAEYYPTTNIDTEVIVKKVAQDVKRKQDYLLFMIKQREVKDKFPTLKPVIYWAQSTLELHLQVKLQFTYGDVECKTSFDRNIEIKDDQFRVTAYCFEGEENIIFYDTGFTQLHLPIKADLSKTRWEGESRAILTLPKQEGPAFQKYVLKDSAREAKEIMVWWDMREKYIEELEEYMNDDKPKEAIEDEAPEVEE